MDHNFGRLLVYWSADFAACGWVLGAVLLLRTRPDEWTTGGSRPDFARLAWAAGWAMLGYHVYLAFTNVHSWSHTQAMAATERLTGVGEGVYVNYLVLFVWGCDAAWLLFAPAGYARRPRWLGRAVHGFLAFVMFNAAVVYVDPAVRWYGAAWFALIGLAWATRPRGRYHGT